MKKQRKYLHWTALMLCGVSFLWAINRMASGGEHLAPGVTRKAIAFIKLGMTGTQVKQILGPPLSERPANYSPAATTLEYSKPVTFARWYPMLWVHLEKDRVVSVFAKRYIYWGADDYYVYMRFYGRASGGPVQELSADIADIDGTFLR